LITYTDLQREIFIVSETLERFEGRLIKEIAKVHHSSRLETMMENLMREVKDIKQDMMEIKNSKIEDAVWKTRQDARLIEGNKKFEELKRSIEKLDSNKLDKKTVVFVAVGFLIANGGLTLTLIKALVV